MRINADFNQRVVVHSEQMDWVDSPMPGVSRRPLDRVGDEVARATSMVRYAPGSHFSSHVHTGGEEFIVLEGVFQDEHGDYPVGSYIRNPPKSSHTPGSEPGCVIFVKLWQFNPSDSIHVRLNSSLIQPVPLSGSPGVSVVPLYKDAVEEVSIEIWEANTEITAKLDGGAEFLVLNGWFDESGDRLVKHSWLRLPMGAQLSAKTGGREVRVWIKRGHLVRVESEEARLLR